MLISADRARAMYAGRRAGPAARRFVRVWVGIIGLGLAPRRWVVLEVPGRSSGRLTRIPLGLSDVGGRWYLVSMLGECHWTKNVRAAGGEVVLDRGRRHAVRLVELAQDDAVRPAVLRRFLQVAPGARPHVPVTADGPDEAVAADAAERPMFLVTRR